MTIMVIRTATVLPFFTSFTVLPFLTSFTVLPMVAVTFPVTVTPVTPVPLPVFLPAPFSISSLIYVTLLLLLSSSVPLSRFRRPSLMWLYLLLGGKGRKVLVRFLLK